MNYLTTQAFYKFAFVFISIVTSQQAIANCRPQVLSYMKSSGFGLSIGGGGSSFSAADKVTVNIPIQVGNVSGCYQQTSKLELKAVSKKTEFNGSIVISPLKASFSGVPESNVTTYIMLSESQSTPRQVQFNVLSAACAGQTVVVAESFTGTLRDVVNLTAQQASASTTTVFATGAAARALQNRLKISEIPAVIAAEFKRLERPVTANATRKRQTVSTPSLMTGSSSSTNNGGLQSGMVSGSMTDTQTICSQSFKSAMQVYNIESLESNPTAQVFRLGKSISGDFIIEF
jgi:hypothetical protein